MTQINLNWDKTDLSRLTLICPGFQQLTVSQTFSFSSLWKAEGYRQADKELSKISFDKAGGVMTSGVGMWLSNAIIKYQYISLMSA